VLAEEKTQLTPGGCICGYYYVSETGYGHECIENLGSMLISVGGYSTQSQLNELLCNIVLDLNLSGNDNHLHVRQRSYLVSLEGKQRT
jgi:hypothetical protein